MKIFLPLVLAGFAAAAVTPVPVCLKPAIRKEWRDLTKHEKKAFIDAAKVYISLPSFNLFSISSWHSASERLCPRRSRSSRLGGEVT